MIIKNIRLIGFGKFNEKNVKVEPGLNIIYGENEAGKTTLHTFIRGMLFGIDKQRGKASSNDLYSKYQPWINPAIYQGVLEIESEGVNYRIERTYDKEHKSFSVINVDEGRQLSEEEIEKLFAGLDESCYYNTVSISQLGSVTDKELEVILKNYAANLGATKSMEIDIKEAIFDLENQKKDIANKNKINEKDSIEKQIRECEDKLDISEREKQTIISEIESRKSDILALAQAKTELSALDAKRLEELAKRNERKDALYQNVISYTADIDKYNISIEEISQQKSQITINLQEKGIDGRETMDILSEKVSNRTNMPVLFIVLMMASIGAVAGFIMGSYQYLAMAKYWIKPGAAIGSAILFLILAIIKYFYNKKKKAKKLVVIKELKLLLDKLEAANHEEVYIQRQLENKKKALKETQELIKSEEEKNLDSIDYSVQIKEIERKEREINEAISKAQWMLEQKQEKDIDVEGEIVELNARLDAISSAEVEIKAIEEAKKNIEEIAAEVRNSFGKKLDGSPPRFWEVRFFPWVLPCFCSRTT